MKLTKQLVAEDRRTRVIITIVVGSKRPEVLMRQERNAMVTSIASGIMCSLPNARHLNVSLSDIKVR